ncbi:MAG: hypothetical protein KAW66_09880 [Candidatus Lokiarchaeota archaeon]|jgi:hypothetical protein|nr:hypothetical protein [Candidatus Lokiarchaeota archaeon]
MKLVINAFILSIIIFISISLGNFVLMWLYLAQQMAKSMGDSLEIVDRSMAVMDNIAIPTGII